MLLTRVLKERPDECELVAREPWPTRGLYEEKEIGKHEWGFLCISKDNGFYFDLSCKPSDEEIKARWGFWINGEKSGSE